jgi:hypothetical protein
MGREVESPDVGILRYRGSGANQIKERLDCSLSGLTIAYGTVSQNLTDFLQLKTEQFV